MGEDIDSEKGDVDSEEEAVDSEEDKDSQESDNEESYPYFFLTILTYCTQIRICVQNKE